MTTIIYLVTMLDSIEITLNDVNITIKVKLAML